MSFYMGKRSSAYMAAVFNAVFIGASFIFTKTLVSGFTPMTGLAFRFDAAFVIFALLRGTGLIRLKKSRAGLRETALIVIFYPILFFSLQAFGMQFASSSEAGIINGIHPVLVALFGIMLLKERKDGFLVYLIPFAGMAAIYMPSFDGRADLRGSMLLLAATVSVSVYMVFVRKYSALITPLLLSWRLICSGAVFFTLWVLMFERPGLPGALNLMATDRALMLSVVFLAVFASIGTSLLTAQSLKYLSAGESAIFINLSTVLSMFLGAAVLGESLALNMIAGSVLIGAGVFMSAYKRKSGF